jgi:two-component system sensor kinase FixL
MGTQRKLIKKRSPKDDEALLQSEARTRAIVNTAVDAIITIDESGIIDSINPASEKLFGYRASELVGRNVKVLMPEPYRREHDGYLRNYLQTGMARIIGIGREVTGMRKDGTLFPLSLAVSEMHFADRRMFTGIIHDLTSRRQLERQILEATASEQRRIGQDLHDGLCQELVSLSLGLEIVARKLDLKGLEEARALQKLGDALLSITDQARRLAHGLNPVDLDAGGLPAALEQLAGRIADSTHVSCEFHWDGRAGARNGTVATHLYRIAQEAVSNAIKHAKPSRIDLGLTETGGNLTLKIEDDGSGLPDVTSLSGRKAAAARAMPPHPDKPLMTGIGLQTMNYRARLIGGTFSVSPRARGRASRSGGTVVTCSLRHEESSLAVAPPTPPDEPKGRARRRH